MEAAERASWRTGSGEAAEPGPMRLPTQKGIVWKGGDAGGGKKNRNAAAINWMRW